MNKRVAKPKRKAPLIPGQDASEAQIERYLRDNHDAISEALREAKAESDAGKGVEVKSLEHFLSLVRKSGSPRK